MKIMLKEWAARNFSPAPHRNTLVNWIKEGHISPMPVFIGRAYFVEETAKYVTDKIEAPKRPDLRRENRKPRLVDRIDAQAFPKKINRDLLKDQ